MGKREKTMKECIRKLESGASSFSHVLTLSWAKSQSEGDYRTEKNHRLGKMNGIKDPDWIRQSTDTD